MGYYVPIADVSPDTSPDIGYQRMSRESIINVKATISLVVGDKIVDNLGKIFEVAYIDYARENIIVVPIDDIAFGNRATVLTFGIVACNYQKVTQQVMDKESIIFALSSISLTVGDEIVDNVDDKYKIAYIDYNCGMVVLNGNGDGDASVLNFNYVARNFKRVVKQNLGAFTGLNYPVTWLLWLHLIQAIGLHTYSLVKPILRGWFFYE